MRQRLRAYIAISMLVFLFAPARPAAANGYLRLTNDTDFALQLSLYNRTNRTWAVVRKPLHARGGFCTPFVIQDTTYSILVHLDGQQLYMGDFTAPKSVLSQTPILNVGLKVLFGPKTQTVLQVRSGPAGLQAVSQPVQKASFFLRWYPVLLLPTSSTWALSSSRQTGR